MDADYWQRYYENPANLKRMEIQFSKCHARNIRNYTDVSAALCLVPSDFSMRFNIENCREPLCTAQIGLNTIYNVRCHISDVRADDILMVGIIDGDITLKFDFFY